MYVFNKYYQQYYGLYKQVVPRFRKLGKVTLQYEPSGFVFLSRTKAVLLRCADSQTKDAYMVFCI